MDDNQTAFPDPVGEFLEGKFPPADNPPFRQALLRETAGVLRRRHWQKRFSRAAAMAGCFLLGALTMRLWHGPTQPVDHSGPVDVPRVAEEPAPRSDTKQEKAAIAPAPLPLAVAKEWNAFDGKDNRAVLFRQAGDLYVQEDQDYASALRCYTQALDAGGEQDLEVAPTDNWLLMALKEARRKEKHNDKNGD